MTDGLTVEFSHLMNSNGIAQIATYRDEDTGREIARAALLPDRGVRLQKFPQYGPSFAENIGDFHMGVAKAILKSYLMSRGYRRMTRATP